MTELFPVTPYQWGHEQFVIRSARAEDAMRLAEIKKRVWQDEDTDAEQITRAINSPDHLTLIVEFDGTPAGFLDSFWTYHADKPCWEMDLLAIDSQFRGRRLGEALVRSSLQYAGDVFSRALIQVNNIASQTSFARCGFTLQKQIHRLYVSDENFTEPVEVTKTAHLIKVTTMSYTGIWLEESFTHQDLLAARHHICEGVALAGSVIPETHKDAWNLAENCAYHYIADYQWWTKEGK